MLVCIFYAIPKRSYGVQTGKCGEVKRTLERKMK